MAKLNVGRVNALLESVKGELREFTRDQPEVAASVCDQIVKAASYMKDDFAKMKGAKRDDPKLYAGSLRAFTMLVTMTGHLADAMGLDRAGHMIGAAAKGIPAQGKERAAQFASKG